MSAALSMTSMTTAAAAADPRPAWVQIETGSGEGPNTALAVAANPTTGFVHVAGTARASVEQLEYDLLLASYTNSGERIGVRLVDGAPAGTTESQDVPAGIVVDPVTSNVFVTANIWPDFGIATVSYTGTGRINWLARYTPSNGEHVEVSAMVRDPATGNLYLGGTSAGGDDAVRALTLAYSPDGELLWQQRAGDGIKSAVALDIAVDSTRGIVYSVGASNGFLTTAYTVGGRRLWTATESKGSRQSAVALDPTSGTLYVVGDAGSEGAENFLTVAYASSGRRLWTRTEDRGGADRPAAIGVDRRSGAVFVAGASSSPAGQDYWTVAYSRTGSVLWRALYDGPAGADDALTALTVDSRRGLVYVTGSSSERQPAGGVAGTTVAYAMSGQRLRVDVFHAGFQRSVYPLAIALDPVRGTVFITGTAHPTDSDTSVALTVAYPPAR